MAPPDDGTPCFYANDFLLEDPAPWKLPASFEQADDLAPLTRTIGENLPEIGWDEPGQRQWEGLCETVESDLAAGHYVKIVPVVTEVGRVLCGELDALVRLLPGLPPVYVSYGYRVGDRGLVGATPERLFTLRGHCLEAMALAGTAPIEREEPFRSNKKEIREHELVADYLEDTLEKLGPVEREARETLHLGSLVHFRSMLSVEMDVVPGVDALVAALHPTPALGVLPRTSENLRRLAALRRGAGTPRRFGAPFGVRVHGEFHGVVGIRHICWRGGTALLPAGCGIITESEVSREWRELALKRESVKRLFGV